VAFVGFWQLVVTARASSPTIGDLQQLGQRCDDTIGHYVSISGKPFAFTIKPDCKNTKPLWSHNLPFQVVTDHPGISCINSKLAESVEVGALIGFAEPVLAFDLDVIKATRQVETFDFGSLVLGCSVGHESEPHAARLERIDDVVRIRKQAHLVIAIGRKPVSEASGDLGRWHRASRLRQPLEAYSDDLAPCVPQPHTPQAMSLGIRPEVPGEGAYGVGDLPRRKGCQLVGKLMGYGQPRRFRPSICANESVIEVE
jgi:hypothetical protein